MSRRYGRKTDPVSSDLIMIWDSSASDWRLTTFADTLSIYQEGLTFPDAGRPEANTQYSSPTISGSTIQINDDNEDTHLYLLLSGALAALTVKFPLNTNVRDKQILKINVTNQITTLTLDINGAAGIFGDISSMGADDFVSYKYDSIQDSWFRIS